VTDWRDIIAALEAAGGYAPARDVARAAGVPLYKLEGALPMLTNRDPRLYEEDGRESPDGKLWLGLDCTATLRLDKEGGRWIQRDTS